MIRFPNPIRLLRSSLRNRRSASQVRALEEIREYYRRSEAEPGGYLVAHTRAGVSARDVHEDDLPEVERLGLRAALNDPDVPDERKPAIAARLARNERTHRLGPER